MKIPFEIRFGHKRVCVPWKASMQAIKREKAEARNAAWNELSLEQKIAELKLRPGNCKRQLKKLGVV